MAYGRDREIDPRSRDLEDTIFEIMREEINNDYTRRKIDRYLAEVCIDVAKKNLGTLAKQCDRDLGQPNYVWESEVCAWVRDSIVPFEEHCVRLIEEAERDRYRDDRRGGYGRRDYYDRGRRDGGGLRYTSRGSYRDDVPGTFGSGARGKQEAQEAQRVADEKRAQVAAAASQRERENDRRQGLNMPQEKTEVSRGNILDLDRKGVTYTKDYAVIATLDPNKEIKITTVPMEVSDPPENHLYHNDTRANVIVGATCPVDTRRIFVRVPVRSFTGAYNIVGYNNPSFATAKHWCYVMAYLKLHVEKAPGIGSVILDVMSEIRKVMQIKDQDPQTRLMNIAIILNDVEDNIRMYFVAKLLRKWNTQAITEFAIPAKPNVFLSASTLEQLQSFYPDSAGADDAAIADKLGILMAPGKHVFLDRLNAAMHQVIGNVFGGQCGYLDMRSPKNQPYLTMFPNLPFVIGQNKRVCDLGQMSDEEKQTLGATFTRDWLCSLEYNRAIVTNLTTIDLTASRRVTCISATDAMVPAYLRSQIDKNYCYAFYKLNRRNEPDYVGHFGMGENQDLMMVRYQED